MKTRMIQFLIVLAFLLSACNRPYQPMGPATSTPELNMLYTASEETFVAMQSETPVPFATVTNNPTATNTPTASPTSTTPPTATQEFARVTFEAPEIVVADKPFIVTVHIVGGKATCLDLNGKQITDGQKMQFTATRDMYKASVAGGDGGKQTFFIKNCEDGSGNRITNGFTVTILESEPTVTATPASASSATKTATPNAGASNADCTDKASLVTDVNYPDGTKVDPQAEFIKTWRLKNVGTCTWTTGDYLAIHDSGQLLAIQGDSVSLPESVAPGETIDVSVPMIAPISAGTYRDNWMLWNDATDNKFGLGSNADKSFWVEIQVVAPATATPVSATAMPASTSVVLSASSVSQQWIYAEDLGRYIHKIDDASWPQSVEEFYDFWCPTEAQFDPTPEALAYMKAHGYISCRDVKVEMRIENKGKPNQYHHFVWDKDTGDYWTVIYNPTSVYQFGFVSNWFPKNPLDEIFKISGSTYRGVTDGNEDFDLCGLTKPEIESLKVYGLKDEDRHSGIPGLALIPAMGWDVYQIQMQFGKDFPNLLTERGGGEYDCAKVVSDRLHALETYTAPAE